MLKRCTDEILLSSDKTIAVIDGSSVLADPAGINWAELICLAKLRKPVENFDKLKLSKDGYLVHVDDWDVKLLCRYITLGPFRAINLSFSQRVKSCWMGPTSRMVHTSVSRLIFSFLVEDSEKPFPLQVHQPYIVKCLLGLRL